MGSRVLKIAGWLWCGAILLAYFAWNLWQAGDSWLDLLPSHYGAVFLIAVLCLPGIAMINRANGVKPKQPQSGRGIIGGLIELLFGVGK